VRALLAAALLATAVWAQVPVPAEVTSIGPQNGADWESYFSGCSLACAMEWTARASSALPPQHGNRYDVKCAEDARARTAWVEGAAGDGVGEWVEFTMKVGAPSDFSSVTVANGYQKSAESFKENGRVAELSLSVNDATIALLELKDSDRVQLLSFPGRKVKPGDRIRLTIAKVYPGAKYHDTALTEVSLGGAH